MGLKRRRCSHGPTCAPKVVAELTPPRGGLEGVCVKGEPHVCPVHTSAV